MTHPRVWDVYTPDRHIIVLSDDPDAVAGIVRSYLSDIGADAEAVLTIKPRKR